ncbi:hypothetical protein AWJ20_3316 [Sugiyamaella lignohabitans]|uniref:Uncharacterized protein n=1 Tax=Sugiyamaella lignohabitans TaxID=796027 RepID=A0A167FTC2_9ASCO|nr:uncharacterized protein AWJ20_3316 [Sugiyamaella lignohabitans]ANB15678.1 hypothetical protein AWJ20_3316 [Sugiyamaella lignohabitans]
MVGQPCYTSGSFHTRQSIPATILPPLSQVVGPYISPSLTDKDIANFDPQLALTSSYDMTPASSYQNCVRPFSDYSDYLCSSNDKRLPISSSSPKYSYSSLLSRPQPRYTSYERTAPSNRPSTPTEYDTSQQRLCGPVCDTPVFNSVYPSPDVTPSQNFASRNSSISEGPTLDDDSCSSGFNTPKAAYGLTRLSQLDPCGQTELNKYKISLGNNSASDSANVQCSKEHIICDSYEQTLARDYSSVKSNEEQAFLPTTSSPSISTTIITSSAIPQIPSNVKPKTKCRKKQPNTVFANQEYTVSSSSPKIRLSQKRYSTPKSNGKKGTQGRPFTDSMTIHLNLAANIDEIFLSSLGVESETIRSHYVEFTPFYRIDKTDTVSEASDYLSVGRRRSGTMNFVTDSSEDENASCTPIKLNHNNIASEIRKLFAIKDFHFVQIVRSSTNQDRNVDRDIKSLPVQKFVAIPCPSNDKEITCRFLKQIVAHPRYKCNMKFFIVKGKIDCTQWHYTSYELMEQERSQITSGEIFLPVNTRLFRPTDMMLTAIGRRRSRKVLSSSKRKLLVEDDISWSNKLHDKTLGNFDKSCHLSDASVSKKIKLQPSLETDKLEGNLNSGHEAIVRSGPDPKLVPAVCHHEETKSSALSSRKTNIQLYNKMSMNLLIN